MNAFRLISGLSALFLSLIILVAPWFHGVTGLKDQFAAQIVIFAFASFLLFYFCLKNNLTFRLTPIDQGMLASLALTGVYVFISALPLYSLMTWVRFLSVAVIYAIARLALQSDRSRRLITGVFLLMGTFYSIYGLFQYYGPVQKDYWYAPLGLASRYVNGGHFAGLLIMPFFLCLIHLLKTRNFFLKTIFLLFLLLFSVVLLLTKSRTCWISLAVCGSCFLISAASRSQRKERLILALALLGAVCIFGFYKAGFTHVVLDRFSEIWNGRRWGVDSIVHRLHFWQSSLGAIIARPWGWGLGTFVHIMPQFKVQADRYIMDYAHNELWQLGVDLGLPGLLMVVILFWNYVRYAVSKPAVLTNEAKIELEGFFWCIMTLILASQFDFPLRIYATALLAAIVLAYQTVLMEKQFTASAVCKITFVPLRVKWGSFVVVIACFVLSGSCWIAQASMAQGARLEKDFEWDGAIVKYRQAIRFQPWDSSVYEVAARLTQKRAALSLNPETKKVLTEQALALFRNAVHRDSFWPASYYWVGVLSQELSQNKAAGEAFRKAHELQPTSDLYLGAYASWQLTHGHLPKALDLLEEFQQISFVEKSPLRTEKILNDVYVYTQNLSDLVRLLKPQWQDRYTLGILLGRHGRWEDAIPQLTQAMQSAQTEWDFDYYMSNLGYQTASYYLQGGRLQEALSIYQEAVQKRPNNHDYKKFFDEVNLQIKDESSEART